MEMNESATTEMNERTYELDEGFLPDLLSEKLRKRQHDSFQVKLPARVQILEVEHFHDFEGDLGKWNAYQFTDGEFGMRDFVLLSAQSPPDKLSVIKIIKVSNLPKRVLAYINTTRSAKEQYPLAQIDFEVETSGSEIGHCLYDIGHSLYYIKRLKMLSMDDIFKQKKLGYSLEEVGSKLLELLNFNNDHHSVEVMKKMWREKQDNLCDVSFTFSPDENKKAFAHKSVLIAASDVFKAHFNREDYCDGNSVHIVDTNFYCFNKMLEFVYTGRAQFATVKVAFELLYLAKKYFLPLLEEQSQNIIFRHYSGNPESILRLLSFNRRSNDKLLQDFLTAKVEQEARRILNSQDFLRCDFATVEWILSLKELHIDEWSVLCALYKWAWHNGVHAFCHPEDDAKECLHGLLECVRFQDIDGKSLHRFFKLPKLPQMVNIDELKQSTFDSILKCVPWFNYKRCTSISTFGRSFSTFRDYPVVEDYFYMEVMVKNDFMDNFEKTPMENLHLRNGSVIGLKVNITPDSSGECKVNVSLAFEFLYTTNSKTGNSLRLGIEVNDFREKRRQILKPGSITKDVSIGEEFDVTLPAADIREYLADRIEDMGRENIEDSEWEKVLGLEIEIMCLSKPDDLQI